MRFKTLVLLFLVVMYAPRSVWAQAMVNEGLETALIYVDGSRGSDSNPGTQALPFRTISAATDAAMLKNQKSIGTRVIISPGTYRESIRLQGNNYDTPAPITFQAAADGVIISGAVRHNGWVSYPDNPAIYTSQWLYNFGSCAADPAGPFQQKIVLRREMIFVNGVPLTQVLAANQMRQGTFFVNENANLVYIWPAQGININNADVEVAERPELFHLVSKSNVVVRGLTFQYANSCRNDSAIYIAGDSQNILLDNVRIFWNNAVGLHIFGPTSKFTVQFSEASHNGQSGMMAARAKLGLWKEVAASFNNWRGAQGSYYNWNSGGLHFFQTHANSMNRVVTAFNQTHGVHWDTDNAGITVNHMVTADNLAGGATVEKSQGPVSITNSHFCSNNRGKTNNYPYQGGLVLRNSNLVSLTASTLYDNRVSQINVIGVKGGIDVVNWETGQSLKLRTQNFVHTGNTIEAVGASQQTITDSYLGGTDWNLFKTSLVSNSNVFWNSAASSVFETPVGQMHGMGGWRTATSQDLLSNWTKPPDLSNSCAVGSDKNFWFVVDNPAQTIGPNRTATFNLDLVPFGGVSGNATLGFDGTKQVPGLTAHYSASLVPIDGSTSFVVHAATGTAKGTYPITFIATNGGITRTVVVSVVVP